MQIFLHLAAIAFGIIIVLVVVLLLVLAALGGNPFSRLYWIARNRMAGR